jgi:hypothetical protein
VNIIENDLIVLVLGKLNELEVLHQIQITQHQNKKRKLMIYLSNKIISQIIIGEL